MEEAAPSLKRQREGETTLVDGEFVEEALKRQKSYKDIISILEEDEDEPNDDISSLITTLQQEISPSSSSPSESSVSDNPKTSAETTTAATEIHSSPTLEHCSSFSSKDGDEEDGEKVMRHLLEASDDELGIPNNDVVTGVGEAQSGMEELVAGEDLINGSGFGVAGDESFDFGVGGMWEFDDDTANYYAMLQSELFLGAGV